MKTCIWDDGFSASQRWMILDETTSGKYVICHYTVLEYPKGEPFYHKDMSTINLVPKDKVTNVQEIK